MIKATNVTKSYNNGKVEALKGVSLEIADGEFVVILGASGSGKSTLMSVLSGLETLDNGDVEVDGQSLRNLTDKQLTQFRRDNIGFVFQQYYLLPHLNVESNVKMGANIAKNNNYITVINAMNLGDKLKAKPNELSGGEQQRVCIARALAKKPKMLFLDEPTGALDEKTGREVLNFIAQQQKQMGFTTIMVTHNSNIAEMAQTVIKMNSGVIIDKYVNSTPKTAYEIGW